MNILYKLTFFLVLVYSLAAQPALESQYKMAESFEKSGDMKNAARIYEEILKADPKNYLYFKGLARSMKASNQFSALLPYIEQQLTYNKYPETYIIYGEILWRSGKVKEAGIAWDQAIESAPNDEKVYDELSNTQINMMLFDKAIATLLKSRDVFDNDLLFTEKLSQLYIATGNFREGTQEVLDAYEANRNLQAAQGKISALMFNDEAKKYINGELNSRSISSRETGYKKIYAWFLSAMGEYENALQKYIEIDEKTNTGGYEVYLYAQSLRIDGVYDIALKAYEFVLGFGKKTSVFQQALFGFARTLEDKFSQDSVSNRTELNKVTDMYEDIIDQFPNTQIAWDCSIRKAEIYLNFLGKTEVAAEELQRMISGTKGSNQKAEALNLLGDVYIALDNLADAYSAFRQVALNYGKNGIADVREKALFRMSEIEYFRGNIDSALAGFKSLSVISTSAFSNDAINKMIIIEDNLKFKDALVLFASAELKEKQKKIDEAIDLYLGTTQKARGETIAEKSYIKAAELSFSSKNYDKARELALELLKLYQNSIYGDYAMMIIADSFYEQGRGEEALQSYTELLKKFNRSIYIEKARQRIRKLRNS